MYGRLRWRWEHDILTLIFCKSFFATLSFGFDGN